MQRQKGFTLLETLIALSLFALGITGFFRLWSINKETHAADNYRAQIELVIEALQKYQYQQRTLGVPKIDEFPTNLTDLVTTDEQFWINCSTADEAARRCVRPDFLPWASQRIGYQAGHKSVTIGGNVKDVAFAEMTFPLNPTVIKPDYRAKWAAKLMTLPYAKQQPNGDVKVTIYDPLLAQLYDAFLQKDGSIPLTDDWDVGGNFSITNTRDITIRNSNGTQKLVSRGLSNVFTVNHGDKVQKPACPTGTTPSINLGLGYVKIEGNYQLVGSQKPYLMSETTAYWQVGLELRVKNLTTNQFDIENKGEILAITQCK
ncbi:type II secretion system protein [Vibrio harveyi]|uniref:type II secretion system protein n=1 Tax=Vibrio harveyi TaxID=669 RepID=UPI0003467166|nr:type II secretion system protein [Vibrio harveyi]